MSPPRRVLVTAGNTHEAIDRVREWTNVFTGSTGLRIAQALAQRADCQILLLTSNHAHAEALAANPGPITAQTIRSHADLNAAMAHALASQPFDAVFMTAAVSDYAPEAVFAVESIHAIDDQRQQWTVRNVQRGKVASTHPRIAVLGRPTEKLVDKIRPVWNHRGLLVKFKLEVDCSDEQLLRIGQASRQASEADWLVANTLDMTTGPRAGAYLIAESSHEWVPRDELPRRLAALLDTQTPAGRPPA